MSRSESTLGSEREGSGIVIADNGLVLTIGYLIVEADDVKIVDNRGRTLPGRVVGYDHATGLGLVKTAVPLDVRPVPFGDSSSVTSTYGGGRYLYDTIKGADLGASTTEFVLDFNFAYNPSCTYDDRWSCPLPPAENRLQVEVAAGERVFDLEDMTG